MPELPEVEAARRAVEENCLGKKITKAIIADDSKVIDGVSRSDFEASITGKTIISARRKGKNMWLELDSPPFPSFQFGMAGAVYIKGVAVTKYKRSIVDDADEWPSKYSKFFIVLDDGLELSFTDKRRFAKVRLLRDPVSVPPISELGPDALLELMTVDEFIKSLSKKKIAIKTLLLDQSFVSGIGNWIADEVLYQARIHPLHTASNLSKESCTTLLKCIKEVIENAIEVGADGSQFPAHWIFHSREKKPGQAFVDGKKIDFITAGGRTTAYVPELQKLSGSQVALEAIKSRRQASKKKHGADNDNGIGEPTNVEDETGKPKKVPHKPRGRGKKPSTNPKSKGHDDDNVGSGSDGNDDEAEEKEIGKKTNVKQAMGGKLSQRKTQTSQNSKNSMRKRRADGDGDDEEPTNEDEIAKLRKGSKPQGQLHKKLARKRKSRGNDDDEDEVKPGSDENEEDDDQDEKKETGKRTNVKEAKGGKAFKDKAPSKQNSKNSKKKSQVVAAAK